jgi:hypothetical protein
MRVAPNQAVAAWQICATYSLATPFCRASKRFEQAALFTIKMVHGWVIQTAFSTPPRSTVLTRRPRMRHICPVSGPSHRPGFRNRGIMMARAHCSSMSGA